MSVYELVRLLPREARGDILGLSVIVCTELVEWPEIHTRHIGDERVYPVLTSYMKSNQKKSVRNYSLPLTLHSNLTQGPLTGCIQIPEEGNPHTGRS